MNDMNATYDSQIEQIVQMIFDTMLATQMFRAEHESVSELHRLLGTVQVTGELPVSIILGVSDGVARASAATMLHVPVNEVTNVDERDVVAEIANMIGGNLKSLLPGTTQLSLPTVVEGLNLGLQVPGAELIDDVMFQCDNGSLRVRVFAKIRNAAA